MSTQYNFKSIIAALFLLLSFNFSFAHWSTKGPYGGHVSAFAVQDTNVFMASPNGGVYRSTNTQLNTWRYYNYTGLGSGKINALSVIGTKVLAGSADSGIYISNDAGISWASSNSGLSNLKVLSLATSQNGKIFAGTDGGGVFISVDSGATWTAMSSGLGSSIINCFVTLGDTVLAGTADAGVYVTITGGNFWLSLNNGLTDTHVSSLAFSLSGVAFVGTPSGVFQGNLTTFTWTLANTGLANTAVHSLLVNGSDIYAGTDAGIYTSPVASVSWSAAGSLNDTVQAMHIYGNKLLAGTKNNGVMTSTVSAFNWAGANNGFNNLTTYSAAAKDSLVVLANEKGVFVCKNFVTSAVYLAANNGLDDSLAVNSLVIAGTKIYAATGNSGVYVTTDTGATWSSANTGLSNLAIKKLVKGSTQLFAITVDGHVFSSPQTSVSWTDNSTGLPANFSVAGTASIGDTVFLAGGTDGLYANTGSGAQWVNTGLSQQVTSVAVSEGAVFAGTAGMGIYKSALNTYSWATANTDLNSMYIQALATVDAFIVAGYRGGAQASCNNGKTWHDFNILQYIPNYSNIRGFTDIVPRIFAITEEHGLLGNSKGEFPEAAPDSLFAITGQTTVCNGSSNSYAVALNNEASFYTWTLPNGWTGTSDQESITAVADTTSGLITVTATNGCGTSVASTLQVTASNCTGINTITGNNIAVYPNPFTDHITITTENLAAGSYLVLSDVTGKTVSSVNITSGLTHLQTIDVQSGVYLLSVVENGHRSLVSRVIKTE